MYIFVLNIKEATKTIFLDFRVVYTTLDLTIL